MRPKLEAFTSLDSINQGIGIANELFMENLPENIVYNT